MELPKDEELILAAQAARKALDEKFGQDIRILDIRKISVLSDYFVIATAGNPNQKKAMCDEVNKALHEKGLRLLHTEGIDTGWALLDYGDIVVHIFGKEEREYYNLERVWGDAAEA